MRKKRTRFPIGLPIAGVILLIAGFALRPVIQSVPEEVVVRNTIIAGIPFILIFVSIIIFFISAIWLLASQLNHRIPQRIYNPIEKVIIAGIVLGVIGMFQPWLHLAYRYGFLLLFISTLAFIVWSHIIPAGRRPQHLTAIDTGEVTEPH
ncbi:MAG: hypothetical protein WBH90_16365 [Aggregatilineales bacterium]|nr:hypothetical protein [Chloroflexota bacterium]HOA23202.1 hypothetical protein [Aggregatilineales bacterium]HPV08897.1 hypothetical protein [Aggregatilineales bacterium]HQE17636.1 hypothetical protein [Aggregatilineales bacterium]